jgi:hypothetical protein
MDYKKSCMKMLNLELEYDKLLKKADATFEVKYSFDGYPLYVASYKVKEKIFMYEENYRIEIYDYFRDLLPEAKDNLHPSAKRTLNEKTIVCMMCYDQEITDEYIDWKDFYGRAVEYLTKK